MLFYEMCTAVMIW